MLLWGLHSNDGGAPGTVSGALYGSLGFFPPVTPSEEPYRETYDWDTGLYIGKIPGWNKTTYNVVGNTNEHQLTIGETTFG